MRGILNGWLVEVHLKFKLLPETLYIAVNLIDRFVEKCPVARKEYQLLGITAMMVASKYEERYPPNIEDFIHISDNTYNREQMIQLEFKLLTLLEFELTFPTCYRFIERFAKIANTDE
jgi:cyclin B